MVAEPLTMPNLYNYEPSAQVESWDVVQRHKGLTKDCKILCVSPPFPKHHVETGA